jgi:maltose alpha-D-glucosyltransferase/alpha-amylase
MVLESVPLPYSLGTALITLIQVEYTEGDAETYLLPLAFASGAQADEKVRAYPNAILCSLRVHRPAEEEPESGLLYDPLGEPAFSKALVGAMARSRRFKRSGAELVAAPIRGAGRLALNGPEPLAEPTLAKTVQSNTTLVFDERWVLKVYRRLEEGINPELEMESLLRDKAGFTQVPPLVGHLEYRRSWGQPMTLAVLLGFVPHQADGWHFTRDALNRFFEHALLHTNEMPQPPATSRTLLELSEVEVPDLAQELIGHYLEAIRQLGHCTAGFHIALTKGAGEPNFAPEPFTTLYQRSLYQSMRSQTRHAFELLRQQAKELAQETQAEALQLLGLEESLLRRAWKILEHKITAQRMRCHGDYHLGQVLYTGKEFMLIDLEGETQRPFSHRRRKRSPLRDVASMLRSFHYAVRFALQKGVVRSQDIPNLEPWAEFWYQWVGAVFLKAYLEVAAQDSFLPRDPAEIATLLDFFLLKRAVNELRDELTNHPDQAAVPIKGLLQLLEARGG